MLLQFLKRLLGFSEKKVARGIRGTPLERLRRACASDFADQEFRAPESSLFPLQRSKERLPAPLLPNSTGEN
jgi:hypothetical protein